MLAVVRLGLAVLFATPAPASAWTRSFVVEWFEPAFYYGGPENGSAVTPGSDCPSGVNDMDWRSLLVTSYRSQQQVDRIVSAEYARTMHLTHLGFRGPHRDNVYENPTVVPDPGFIEVSGQIAEGFNLDNDESTGFVSPTGEKGIDNAYYKVSGCVLYWRGPTREGAMIKRINDLMHVGGWSTLVVVTGQGDPQNDEDVSVGIYNSNDAMVRDASGDIVADYSFRIDPDPRLQTVFKARIRHGVLENIAPILFKTHELSPDVVLYDMAFYQAQVRWQLRPDGSMDGLVGGYRLFFDHYRNIASGHRAFGSTAYGAVRESIGHFSLPGWYYAMRRAADGLRDPITGRYIGISTTYRFFMRPAYVVTPDGSRQVLRPPVYE